MELYVMWPVPAFKRGATAEELGRSLTPEKKGEQDSRICSAGIWNLLDLTPQGRGDRYAALD